VRRGVEGLEDSIGGASARSSLTKLTVLGERPVARLKLHDSATRLPSLFVRTLQRDHQVERGIAEAVKPQTFLALANV
jgi:hypothetical protein